MKRLMKFQLTVLLTEIIKVIDKQKQIAHEDENVKEVNEEKIDTEIKNLEMITEEEQLSEHLDPIESAGNDTIKEENVEEEANENHHTESHTISSKEENKTLSKLKKWLSLDK